MRSVADQLQVQLSSHRSSATDLIDAIVTLKFALHQFEAAATQNKPPTELFKSQRFVFGKNQVRKHSPLRLPLGVSHRRLDQVFLFPSRSFHPISSCQRSLHPIVVHCQSQLRQQD